MENIYKTTTLPSGATITEIDNPITEQPIETPQPTLEDKVNYLYYKSKGVI